MLEFFKKSFSSLLDFIYKKKCYFCNSSKYSLKMCPKCYDELIFAPIQANRIIDGVDVYCCGIYEKNLQKLIRGLKFHKQKELAYYLAKFMYEYWSKLDDKREFQIVPVPLHKNRIKRRKYNQMELVGEEFSRLSGYELNSKLITRIKDTKPQYKLSRKERLSNLYKAFSFNQNNFINKPVLLIDDICTTGATFEEIIKELKNNGVNEIICLSASNP